MRHSCDQAVAHIMGGPEATDLSGTVRFSDTRDGVLVTAHINGLPHPGFFAFHIHEGGNCGGEGFSHTGGHFNPCGTPHPMHAGDLPPLLSRNGKAFLAVLTDRFHVCDIIGRTIVIHSGPDDFHTQPSGNPGMKLACGLIHRV